MDVWVVRVGNGQEAASPVELKLIFEASALSFAGCLLLSKALTLLKAQFPNL